MKADPADPEKGGTPQAEKNRGPRLLFLDGLLAFVCRFMSVPEEPAKGGTPQAGKIFARGAFFFEGLLGFLFSFMSDPEEPAGQKATPCSRAETRAGGQCAGWVP